MRTSRWRKWAVGGNGGARFFGRFWICPIGFDGRIQAQGQDQDGTAVSGTRKTNERFRKSQNRGRRHAGGTCEKHARLLGDTPCSFRPARTP